jgi:enamine deaminase RidA (YjgF/YER057c/UK114 family)
MSRLTISVALSTVLSVVALSNPLTAQATRQYVDPRTPADTSALPFSGGVLVGNTFYLAGKIGLTPDRRVPATAAEEARLVLEDVKAALAKVGMSMDDLVSLQIFCSDVSHYNDFNRVYRTYFTKEFPARAFLGSGPLLFGARFEVQGIAVKR